MEFLGAFIVVGLMIFGIGVVMTVVALLLARPERAMVAPINAKLACANCGKHHHREHMYPVKRGDAVAWLCSDELKKGALA